MLYFLLRGPLACPTCSFLACRGQCEPKGPWLMQGTRRCVVLNQGSLGEEGVVPRVQWAGGYFWEFWGGAVVPWLSSRQARARLVFQCHSRDCVTSHTLTAPPQGLSALA